MSCASGSIRWPARFRRKLVNLYALTNPQHTPWQVDSQTVRSLMWHAAA